MTGLGLTCKQCNLHCYWHGNNISHVFNQLDCFWQTLRSFLEYLIHLHRMAEFMLLSNMVKALSVWTPSNIEIVSQMQLVTASSLNRFVLALLRWQLQEEGWSFQEHNVLHQPGGVEVSCLSRPKISKSQSMSQSSLSISFVFRVPLPQAVSCLSFISSWTGSSVTNRSNWSK